MRGARGGLAAGILNFLYPPRCPFCRRVLEEEDICPDCQRSLPWLTGGSAQRKVEHIALCASALEYDGLVRSCIHRFKFQRKHGCARVLGTLTAQCAHDHLSGDFDLVSWPPLSPKSLRQRGFDQSQLLARAVAAQRGMVETALFTKKNTVRRQSQLKGYAARRANVLGAFTLKEPALVQGRRVLLVDDVVTTGATLTECARVLLTAGAKEVCAVTLASARAKPRR